MFGLRVAAVGDGACAVFLSGGGTQPVGIIDCGSASHPSEAADGLRRVTDLTRHPSLTIVVSHLHADHYNGLRYLPRSLNRRYVFGKVVLVQARLPRHPIMPEFVARLFSMELLLGEVSGIPDLDLAAELARTSRYGLIRAPKSAGETFDMGGHTFEVLWPPAELTSAVSIRVHRAVDNFDALAAKNRSIAEALERVREAGLPRLDPWSQERAHAREDVGREIDDEDDFGASGEDNGPAFLHEGHEASPIRRPSYPESLVMEVRRAAHAFADAANYMSMVVSTRRRDFTAWGDVPPPLARRIARRHQVAFDHWVPRGVALAPHHGSQGPTPSLGRPFLCMAQNGPGLHGKWASKHEPCVGLACLSTQEIGDVSFPPNEWPWYRAPTMLP